MSIKRFAFTVHGEVQGVNFRRFTQNAANDLSLYGYVRNDKSGTVTGEAQGEPDVLEQFKAKLGEGNRSSSVTGVDWKEVDVRGEDEGHGPGGSKSRENFMVSN